MAKIEKNVLSWPELIKKIGLIAYIRSRILSPKEVIYGFLHWRDMFCGSFSLRSALFCARYQAGKCIEGYDFY